MASHKMKFSPKLLGGFDDIIKLIFLKTVYELGHLDGLCSYLIWFSEIQGCCQYQLVLYRLNCGVSCVNESC